ncbi:MAG TPA: tyrosine-type recombinase/integrase, partial [Jiangellaceae bacterium]
PHELRHTAASLAVSAGANAKAVQRMLGHAKASKTLDVYAELFDDDLEAVADRLDEIAQTVDRGRTADYPRTGKVVVISDERTTRP